MRDSTTAFNVNTVFASTPTQTSSYNLTINTNNAARTISLAGSLLLGGGLTTTGAFTTTLIAGAATTLTLPIVSGILATLAGIEPLSNKTITLSTATSITVATSAVTDTVQLTLRDANAVTQQLQIRSASTPNMTALRIFSIDVKDSDRTLTMNGNMTLGDTFSTSSTFSTAGIFSTGNLFTTVGAFITTGAFSTTLIAGANVSLTLPLISGTLATLAGTETLTGKTITAAIITDTQTLTLRDAITPAQRLRIRSASIVPLTAQQDLIIDVSNGNRILSLAGDVAFAGAFVTTGAFSTTLTALATTVLTLPSASGTLATLAGSEILTNKTITKATALSIQDFTTAARALSIVSNSAAPVMSADRKLTFDVKNADRIVTLSGDLTMAGSFNTTFTAVATTNLTLPLISGILVTQTGFEPLTNKDITNTGSLAMKDSTNGLYQTNIVSACSGIDANRVFSYDLKNASRLLTLGGDLTIGGAFTTTGAFSTTFAAGATTVLTLPVVSGTLATLLGTETLNNKTLNTPIIPIINGSTGITSLIVGTVASAVNAAQVTPSVSGSPVIFGAAPFFSSDTNVSVSIVAKGTGNIILTNTTAANYMYTVPAIATASPIIAVAGTDTDIPLRHITKGTGTFEYAGGSGPAQLRLFGSATVNYVGIAAPTTPASYTMTLPAAQATAAGQTLNNNGSGVLSWTVPNIPYYNSAATGTSSTFTTTLISILTAAPPTLGIGTYLIMFNCMMSLSTTGFTATVAIYLNGTIQTNTPKTVTIPGGGTTNLPYNISTHMVAVIAAAGTTVDIQGQTTGGTASVTQKMFSYLRIA
jgi:hypothetical protein